MLVLAFRPAPARPLLVDALAGAVRDSGVVWLPLEPLSRSEADRLLDDELPEPARAALFVQSGGNPFYLQELARASTLSPAGAWAADVPRRVALAMTRRSAHCRRTRSVWFGRRPWWATRWLSMSRSWPPSSRRDGADGT